MKIVDSTQSEDSEVTILNVFTLDLPPPPRIPVSSEGLVRDSLLIVYVMILVVTGILGERSDPMFYLLLYFYGHVQCTIFINFLSMNQTGIANSVASMFFFHLLTLTFGK